MSTFKNLSLTAIAPEKAELYLSPLLDGNYQARVRQIAYLGMLPGFNIEDPAEPTLAFVLELADGRLITLKGKFNLQSRHSTGHKILSAALTQAERERESLPIESAIGRDVIFTLGRRTDDRTQRTVADRNFYPISRAVEIGVKLVEFTPKSPSLFFDAEDPQEVEKLNQQLTEWYWSREVSA